MDVDYSKSELAMPVYSLLKARAAQQGTSVSSLVSKFNTKIRICDTIEVEQEKKNFIDMGAGTVMFPMTQYKGLTCARFDPSIQFTKVAYEHER